MNVAVSTSGMWIDQQVLKAQPEVREQRAALGDRGDDAAEVVVEQHDRRHLARAAGALVAHRDADVGGLQRRDVVDAVAGDRDELAGPLQRAHDRELLRRHRARDDVDVAERGRRRLAAVASSSPVITTGAVGQAHLARDRARRRSGGRP